VADSHHRDVETAAKVFTDGPAFSVCNSFGACPHKSSPAEDLPGDVRAKLSTLEDPWLLQTMQVPPPHLSSAQFTSSLVRLTARMLPKTPTPHEIGSPY